MFKIIKNQISKYFVLLTTILFSYVSGATVLYPCEDNIGGGQWFSDCIGKETHKICSIDRLREDDWFYLEEDSFECHAYGCQQMSYVGQSCFYKGNLVMVITVPDHRACENFLRPNEDSKIICDQPMSDTMYNKCKEGIDYIAGNSRRYEGYDFGITCDQLRTCLSIYRRPEVMAWATHNKKDRQKVKFGCSVVQFHLKN